MTSFIYLVSALIVLVISTVACSPFESKQLPQKPKHAAYDGTFTGGGGGNGIDGKAVETFAVKVETLSEYRLYIQPLLQRLRRGNADVLAAYLNWAVNGKVWYFVPVELGQLPNDRIALSFHSEQLARHSEKEIFIYSVPYKAKSRKERAFLLLHEMVMAARLLMKKSPKDQCEVLSKGSISACHNEEMLKLAQANTTSTNDSHDLNGDDHEAVRALTVFLMEPEQDLSGDRVREARRKLQYHFPWDQAIAQIDFAGVMDALKRSRVSYERYRTHELVDEAGKPALCHIRGYHWDKSTLLSLHLEVERNGSSTEFPGNSLHERPDMFRQVARGTILPGSESQVVDVVTFTPRFSIQSFQHLEGALAHEFELYISRDAVPRILRIHVIKKYIMVRSRPNPGELGYELVTARNTPPIQCVVE